MKFLGVNFNEIYKHEFSDFYGYISQDDENHD